MAGWKLFVLFYLCSDDGHTKEKKNKHGLSGVQYKCLYTNNNYKRIKKKPNPNKKSSIDVFATYTLEDVYNVSHTIA